jgi:hypothetical protein
MRDITGWVGGALGAAALLGAFYLGGRASAAPATASSAAPAPAAIAATVDGVEFACAPGQRVVMRDATATTPRSAACVGDTANVPAPGPTTVPAYVPIAAAAAAPAVHRTVAAGPLEVYRPRAVPVSYESERAVRRRVRTKTKSAVIIGSSAAVGATIGGLTKGTKGAIIGGIVGGGAATVWDQVTRRQGEAR